MTRRTPQDTLEAAIGICIEQARFAGFDGPAEEFEPSQEDIEYITFYFRRRHNRAPTRSELRDAGIIRKKGAR